LPFIKITYLNTCVKIYLTLLAPSPTYISTNSQALILIKNTPHSLAVALASKVLPVPGGP